MLNEARIVPVFRDGTYWNDVSGKELLKVSFSGGRTSGYMAKRLLDGYSDTYDFIITFANTSREHNKTLDFVHNCDEHFDFNTVWLEGVVQHGQRKSSTHRVVDYETARRDGSVFAEYIKKYGIPNTAFPQCTRELKTNPMHSYLRSLGIEHRKIKTAIGIRSDEKRRVSSDPGAFSIIYPLIDWFPTDKTDVLDWWSEQAFDLEIDEFQGNCLGCFKKSHKKLFMQIEEDPSVFDFTREMEDAYRWHGPQDGQRVFFRGNLDTRGLFRLYEELKGAKTRPIDAHEDGGCSESCEVYETLVEEV